MCVYTYHRCEMIGRKGPAATFPFLGDPEMFALYWMLDNPLPIFSAARLGYHSQSLLSMRVYRISQTISARLLVARPCSHSMRFFSLTLHLHAHLRLLRFSDFSLSILPNPILSGGEVICHGFTHWTSSPSSIYRMIHRTGLIMDCQSTLPTSPDGVHCEWTSYRGIG